MVSGFLPSSWTVSIVVSSSLSPLTFLITRVRTVFFFGLPSSEIDSSTRTSSGSSLVSSGCSSTGISSTVTVVSGCLSSSSTVSILVTSCLSPFTFLITRVRTTFFFGLPSSETNSITRSSSGSSLISSGCFSIRASSTVTVVSGCLSSSSTVSILVTSCLSPLTFLITRVRITFFFGLPSSLTDSTIRTSSGSSLISSGCSSAGASSTVTVVSGCLSSSSTVSILVTSCLSPLTFLITRASSTVTVVSDGLSSSSTVSILVTSCLSPLTFLITRVRITFFFGLPSSVTDSRTRTSSGSSLISSGCFSKGTSSTVTEVSGCLSSSSTVSILVTCCLSPLTFLITRVRTTFFFVTDSTTRTSSGSSLISSGCFSIGTSSTVTVVSGCLSSSSTVSILVTSCLSPLTFLITRVRITFFFGLPSSVTDSTTRTSSGSSLISSGCSSIGASSTVTVVSGCLSSSSTVSILVTSCLSPLTFLITRVRITFFFGLPSSVTDSTTRTSSGSSLISSGCFSKGTSSTVTVVSGCLSSSSTVSILVTSCLSPFTFLITRVRITFFFGLPSSVTDSTRRTSSGSSLISSGCSSIGASSTVTVVSGCLSSSSTVSILVTSCLSPLTFLITRVRITFFFGLPSSVTDSTTRTSSGSSLIFSGCSSIGASSTVTVVSGCLSSSSTVSILVTSCLSPLIFLITHSTTRTSSGSSLISSGCFSIGTSSTVTVVSGCLSFSSTVSILVTSCLSPLTFLITRVRITFFFGLPSSVIDSTTRTSSGSSLISSGCSSIGTSSTVTVVSGCFSSSSTVSILVTSCLSPLTFLITRVRTTFFFCLPSSETDSITRTSSGSSLIYSGCSSIRASSTVTVVSGCLSSSSTVSILVTSCLSPLTFLITRVRITFFFVSILVTSCLSPLTFLITRVRTTFFFGLPSSETDSTTRTSSGSSLISSGCSSTGASSTVTVVSGCLSSSSTVSILVTCCLSPLTFLITRVRIIFFFGLPSSVTDSTTRTSSGSSLISSGCSSRGTSSTVTVVSDSTTRTSSGSSLISSGCSSIGVSSTVTVVSGCLSSSSTVSILVTACLSPLTFLITRVRITFFFGLPSSVIDSTTRTSSGSSLISSGCSSIGTSSTVTVVSGCFSSSSTVSILVTSCLSPLTFLITRVRITFFFGLPSSVKDSTTRTSSGSSLISSGCSSIGTSSTVTVVSGCFSSSSTVSILVTSCLSPLTFLMTRVRITFFFGLPSSVTDSTTRTSSGSSLISLGCSSIGASLTFTVVSGCLSSSSIVSILVTSCLSPLTFLITRVRITLFFGLPSSVTDSTTRISSGSSLTSSLGCSSTGVSPTVTVVSGCLSSSSTVSILVTSCLSPLTFLMTRVRTFFFLGLPSSEIVSIIFTSSGSSLTSSLGCSSTGVSSTVTVVSVTVVSGGLSSSSTVSILVTSCLSPLTFLVTRVRIFFFLCLPSSEIVSIILTSSGSSLTSGCSSTGISSTVTVVSGCLSSSSTVSILVTSCLSPLTFLMTRVRIFFFLGFPSSEIVSIIFTSSGNSFTSSCCSSTGVSSTVTVVSGCLSSSSTVSILVTSCLSPLTFFMTRVRIFFFLGFPSFEIVSIIFTSSGSSLTSSCCSLTGVSSTVTVVSGCLSSSSIVSILVTSCLSPLTFLMTRVRIFFFLGLPSSEIVSITLTSSGSSLTSSFGCSATGVSSTVTVVSGCLSSSSTVSILVTSCLLPFIFLMTRVRIFFFVSLPSVEIVSTSSSSDSVVSVILDEMGVIVSAI
ncbi:hypothetical protein FF38_03042 [Lucilia cuprina]|uniref:Uncharacterized protein n=1 Tax=Lucilia cuprina TaxID=7375 RepID=A0A0L0CGY3_LUCCU|nr:hypothetical protein FF38_03042 [Lucilia cuprina]